MYVNFFVQERSLGMEFSLIFIYQSFYDFPYLEYNSKFFNYIYYYFLDCLHQCFQLLSYTFLHMLSRSAILCWLTLSITIWYLAPSYISVATCLPFTNNINAWAFTSNILLSGYNNCSLSGRSSQHGFEFHHGQR